MKTDYWEDEGDSWYYMYVVDKMYSEVADSNSNRVTVTTHRFLEFLSALKIIEYTRGYDGIYYDIRIMKRGK